MNTTIFHASRGETGITARIGLILISTDEVGCDAFLSMMPREVAVFPTRVGYTYTGAEFRMAGDFRQVLSTLPPAGRLEVVAFSCTSCAISMGLAAFQPEVEAVRRGIRATSPAGAGIAALRHLG